VTYAFLAGFRELKMEALLIIGGIVALVWGAVVMLRGGLLGGGLAVLLAAIVFGYPFFHVTVGPAPVTLDRFLWVVLVIQYLIWRRHGLADPKPRGKSEVALILFMLVLAVSTLAHDWQAHNNAALARLVFFYLMPLGMYWVARGAKVTERGMYWLFGSLALLGVYLAATAIAETQQARSLVFPSYIAAPELKEFLGRGRGPLLNPIGNGILMGTAWGAMLLGWPRVNRFGRLMLLALSLLMGVGVYCTLTRCAWIGAGLGLVLLMLLTVPRIWSIPILGSGLVAASLLAVTHWEQIVAFKRDQGAGAQETADSVRLRPILARVAWNMFLDRPLLGCGLAHYMDRHVDYLDDRSTELVLEKARPYCQHNVFLSLLTETGLVGLGLLVAVLWNWACDAWRLWRCREAPTWARQQGLLMLVLLINYVANGFFHDVSLMIAIQLFLFFMAGVTASLRPWTQESYRSRRAWQELDRSDRQPALAAF
jgi:O-antigen ligase